MQTVDDSTIDHVRKSVVNHNFADSTDWVEGLEELADMSDDDIESIVSFRPFLFPLPLGVSPQQAQQDRELYDRICLEVGLVP